MDPTTQKNLLSELYRAILLLKTPSECERFFSDLCTPAEMSAMADRWATVGRLVQGQSYRAIYQATGVSTATVTRVARTLEFGKGGYRLILERQNLRPGEKTLIQRRDARA